MFRLERDPTPLFISTTILSGPDGLKHHNMNIKTNQPTTSQFSNYFSKHMLKSLLVSTFILAFLHLELSAQEIQYTKPSWYFGVAGAANLNYHDGNIQRLNSGFATPAAFSDGQGIGVYAAPLVEFHRPESMLGFMLQAGYDGRRGDFDEMIPGCNCPAELLSNFSYITVEPSLKFAPFRKGFYVYAGPRLAFNLDKRFVYKQGTDPNLPNQEEPLDVFQDFDNVNDILISMQVGAG